MNEARQRNHYLPYFDEEGNLIEGVTPFNKRGGKITINNNQIVTNKNNNCLIKYYGYKNISNFLILRFL